MATATQTKEASSLLRISEAAAIGLHAAVLLAAYPDRFLTTREIARDLEVSDAHLSKVLQRLVQAGILEGVRGPGGGFCLAQAPYKTSLLEVYEAIDGPLSSGSCLLRTPICSRKKCIMGGLVGELNREVKRYLSQTRLSQLAERN